MPPRALLIAVVLCVSAASHAAPKARPKPARTAATGCERSCHKSLLSCERSCAKTDPSCLASCRDTAELCATLCRSSGGDPQKAVRDYERLMAERRKALREKAERTPPPKRKHCPTCQLDGASNAEGELEKRSSEF